MPSQNNDPMIGRLIGGQYEVQRLIGKGGMAYVYMGQDTKQDREVAIKIITLQRDRANELMKRFQREERVIRQIDTHPNIIKIYDSGAEDQDTHYLLMELIRGETLTQRLKRYRRKNEYMPFDEVLKIMSQTADAIDHVHRHNAIHRDIKPSNIMIEKGTDRAVLMDFGLVMDFANNTTLGTAFGTPRYISPEQAISSQQAVPQSDIYSLGIVLYETLVGNTPFDEDSAMSMALSHITNPPPHPQHYRDDLPDEIATVVLKALEKQPEDRYETARAMIDALEQAVGMVVDPTEQRDALPIQDASMWVTDTRDPAAYDPSDFQADDEREDTEGALEASVHGASDIPAYVEDDEPLPGERGFSLPLLLAIGVVLLAIIGGLFLVFGSEGNTDNDSGRTANDATPAPLASSTGEQGGVAATTALSASPSTDAASPNAVATSNADGALPSTLIGFNPTDDMHLYYSPDALFIFNNTSNTVDLTRYRLRLLWQGQRFTLNTSLFEANKHQLPANTCIRVALQGQPLTGRPDVCNGNSLVEIFHQRRLQQEYYWVWDATTNPDVEQFQVVTINGQSVQDCSIAEGRCSFNLVNSG